MMIEGAKPIEAGCKALLIRSKNNHGEVIVGDLTYNSILSPYYSRLWSVDREMHWTQGMREFWTACAPEKCLMRIDDPEINEQIEDELEVVV